MNEADASVLKQIVAHIDAIEQRIEKYSINEETFVSNDEFQDMLLMPVFQIGELANSLSDELQESHAEIPWHAIIAFRNIIAHDYGVVDPMWAWNTIEIDMPNPRIK